MEKQLRTVHLSEINTLLWGGLFISFNLKKLSSIVKNRTHPSGLIPDSQIFSVKRRTFGKILEVVGPYLKGEC